MYAKKEKKSYKHKVISNLEPRDYSNIKFIAQRTLKIGGILYKRRNDKNSPINIKNFDWTKVSEELTSATKTQIKNVLEKMANSGKDNRFESEDHAVKSIIKNKKLGRIYKKINEVPFHTYGKDYQKNGATKGSEYQYDGNGIPETAESRRRALELLHSLETELPNERFMFAVCILKNGLAVAAKSGRESRAFESCAKRAGFITKHEDPSDLKGYSRLYQVKTQRHTTIEGHNVVYGDCALPKAISISSKFSNDTLPIGITEIWFDPQDQHPAVEIGEGGVKHQYKHGVAVPSCDSCRYYAKNQLNTEYKYKQYTAPPARAYG